MGYLDPDADYGWHPDTRPAVNAEGVECHAHDCRHFIADDDAAVRHGGWWYCLDCAAAFETDDQHDAEDAR